MHYLPQLTSHLFNLKSERHPAFHIEILKVTPLSFFAES